MSKGIITIECSRCNGALQFDPIEGGIMIHPCEVCMREEFMKGDESGYDAGYRTGLRDGERPEEERE